MKQGSILVDMEIDGYRPLGAFGQPVHKSYVQLHAAVKQRLGARCADLFARPQWDERNRRIRWISPIAGDAVSWRDMAEEEQAERALDLQIIRAEFDSYLRDLRADGNQRGGEAFASVLDQALKTPNDGHLHFIGEQPVMTFWGFSELSGDRFDPLSAMPPPEPKQTTTVPPVGVAAGEEERVRRFPAWLLWLIPLLLLLLLLLLWWFLWKDEPAAVTPPSPSPVTEQPLEDQVEDPLELPPGEPVIEQEGLRELPDDRYRYTGRDGVYDWRDLRVDEQGRVVDENGDVVEGLTPDELAELQGTLPDAGVVDDPLLPEGEDIVPGEPVEEVPTDEIPLEDGVLEPGEIPAEDVPGEIPDGEIPEDAIDETQGDAGDVTPPLPDPTAEDPATQTPEDAIPGEELALPSPTPGDAGEENAPGEGDQSQTNPGAPDATAPVDFLQGQWRSKSDLTDEQGNKLDQTYKFDDKGKGQSIVRRADGVTCSAPAEARRQGGKLTISELENLRCADGREIEKSETECVRGTDGRTRCSGGGFNVQIERPE